MAWLWLLVRVYVGWGWLQAGWEKLHSAAWTGAQAGTALAGFVAGALQKTGGANPEVQGWYGTFLQTVVHGHLALFSFLVAYGETLVGVAMILGVVTGIAAFFGCFLNMNYLLAGAISVNPIWLALSLFLILAWRIAGWYGADRWVLPAVGTPWAPGPALRHHDARKDAA
jgi:thiosulfate dehydrogenase [quinone] large subunit